MGISILKNQTKNQIIVDRLVRADTFFTRMTGLLNRHSLNENEGLLITQCRSIHMLFMRFAIDVVFVDRNHVVVGLVKNIKPFQLSPIFWRASYAVELPSGSIDRQHIDLGDILAVE